MEENQELKRFSISIRDNEQLSTTTVIMPNEVRYIEVTIFDEWLEEQEKIFLSLPQAGMLRDLLNTFVK